MAKVQKIQTMKKTFTILMALIVLCFTQCKKPVDNEATGRMVKVSCTIPINKGSKSDFTNLMEDGSIKWSTGTERIYLALPNETNPQIVELTAFSTLQSSELAFEGEVDENLINEGEEYEVWYLGNSKNLDVPYITENKVGEDEIITSVSGSIAEQSGSIEDLGLCHIAKVSVTAVREDGEIILPLRGVLKNQIAIAYLDLEGVKELSGAAIKGTEYNLQYNESANKYDFVVTENASAAINVTAGTSKSFIVLLPNDNNNVILKCSKGGYEFKKGVEGNKFYYRYVSNEEKGTLRWEEMDEEEPGEPGDPGTPDPEVPSNPPGTFTVNGVTFTMIKVEGNGSDISDYYIGETEVTQELWQAVMDGSNPSEFKGPQRPVEQVSLEDCQEFVEKLNLLTGENFIVPTQSQWLRAASGGNKSQGYTYSGSNNVGDVAWYKDNSSNQTHDVKTKSPNELGIYDMSGNVAEWTSGYHGGLNKYRFYGGAFPHSEDNCKVEYYSYNTADTKANDIGFRLCVSTITNPGQPEEPEQPEEPTVPAAPANLVATATGQTTISLTWNAVQNATSYNVYNGETVVVSGLTVTSYTVEGLTAGTEYCYNVTAVNEIGESEHSAEACATTESVPTAPAPPTNLVATATGQTTISLTWNAVQNATSYNVYNGETVVVSGLTVTSYTVEGLTAGTEYCYKVTAVNEVGESEASTEACATTEFPPIVVETITVNGVSFNMIQVEGGTFTMGSVYDPLDGITDCADEEPAHSVTLTTYSIGETEVTQELWKAVMGSDSPASAGEYTKKDDYYPQRPAEFMTWGDCQTSYIGDCQTFISKLNELTGKNFRLPTEAEWEYAARGGNRSKGYMYSGSNDVGEVAWYSGNLVDVEGKTKTHDVKTKKANELGIYDMSGNVLEWCNDWYDDDYYGNSPGENPQGPDQAETSTKHRVSRGGGWGHEAEFCRVAKRFSLEQDKCGSNYGFRLCL